MNFYLIVLRFIHIVSGAFWFGAATFNALLLMRAVAAEGQAGSKVMDRMMKIGMPMFFAVSSVLSVASGLLLYLRIFGSLVPPLRLAPQIGFAAGGIAGFLAFLTVFGMHTPLAMKMGSVQREIQAGTGPPTDDQMMRLQALGKKMRSAALTTFVLLLIAISMMSISRYLYLT